MKLLLKKISIKYSIKKSLDPKESRYWRVISEGTILCGMKNTTLKSTEFIILEIFSFSLILLVYKFYYLLTIFKLSMAITFSTMNC